MVYMMNRKGKKMNPIISDAIHLTIAVVGFFATFIFLASIV
jgi:hypothetical protein